MRGAGISSAGISADVTGAEDQAQIEGGEDGGMGEGPQSATGDDLAGGAGGEPG